MRNIVKAWAILPHIAIIMFVPIFGCILLGHFLDGIFGTEVVFLIIFVILGVGAAFRSLYVFCMRFSEKSEKDDNKHKSLDIEKITGKK